MSKKKIKRSPVSVLCSILGTIILVIVVVGCIPLTVPRLFGYNIYSVVSGSMEPAIPTGSIVYVTNMQPEDVKEDDVIAFYGALEGGAIITHRVVSNSPVMGQFITKGDANEEKDMNPIPYQNFIGKVVFTIPKLGIMAEMLTSLGGKIAAGVLIGVAVILEIVAALIE